MSPRPFALGTFAGLDRPFAGIVVDDDVFELDAGMSVRSILDDWDAALPALQQSADDSGRRGTSHRLADLRPLPPVTPPGQIFQAGANYRQHVLDLIAGAQQRGDGSDGLSEGGDRERAARDLDERAAHGTPFIFQGCAHALCGAIDDIVLPAGARQPDWELELAAIIGRPARQVSREHALDHVAGYTIANDLTLRDRLARSDVPGGLDWLAAKNPPTFLPLGPLFVPAVHAGDPSDLRITLSVNGKIMQDSSTSDMLFDVAALVAYASQVTALAPGDLLLTGSPAGNGASHGVFLAPGDELHGRIEGLGEQRNRCVAERSAAKPDLTAAR